MTSVQWASSAGGRKTAGERDCWSPQSQFFPERLERILTCCNTMLFWKYHWLNYCIRFLRTFLAFQQFSSCNQPCCMGCTHTTGTPRDITILPALCNTSKAPAKHKNKACKLCQMGIVYCWQDLCETGHRADLLVEVDQGLKIFLSIWRCSVMRGCVLISVGLHLLQPLGHPSQKHGSQFVKYPKWSGLRWCTVTWQNHSSHSTSSYS